MNRPTMAIRGCESQGRCLPARPLVPHVCISYKDVQMHANGSLCPSTIETRYRLVCRSGNEGSHSESQEVNEALLERLRAAEEEAQRLKSELEEAKAAALNTSSGSKAADMLDDKSAPTSRIDGGDLRRETLAFVESKPRNWLSEADVEFFTGGGPSEISEGDATSSKEESEEIRRRILIGLGITAAVGAFALIPTEKLQPPPSKPLFFYLVPLLRVEKLLTEAESVIPEGDYQALKTILARIEGPPNNVQDNLRQAAASLTNSKQVEAAEYVARDVYEYLKGIDYQTYFESVGGGPGGMKRGGSEKGEMFEFSKQSATAARKKLKEFLALMPVEQVEAAQQQVDVLPF